MEIYIKVTIKMISAMEKVFYHIPMVKNMKVIIQMIRKMVKALFILKMGIYIKVTIKMVNAMERVSIPLIMAISTMAYF